MEDPPVRVGIMLYTLIEPHPGRHRAYNRWYERDHFYSGVMTLPGTLSGQRWVATPALKARRHPSDSPVVPDPRRGSFLTTYFVDADRVDEWDVAASHAVQALATAGRLWPERDHVLTRFLDYGFATYRDDDPVPAVQTLDHRYPGLVTVVGRAADGVPLAAALDALRTRVVLAALPGSAVPSVLTFTVRPFAGERPSDLPVDPDPESRFLQLWFVEDPPDLLWDDVFVPLAQRFADDPMLRLEWMGGFVPTVPGTDTHVGLLEAAEAAEATEAAEAGAEPTFGDPRSVVAEYFRRVREADPHLAELFHEDARLVGLGTVVEGRPAIAAFYADATDRAAPSPRLVGPMLVEGARVAAEIVIDLAGGVQLHVVDLFEIDDGRIRGLTYFVADH